MDTFQDKVPICDEWNSDHIESCRFLAKSGEDVLGWVALSYIK